MLELSKGELEPITLWRIVGPQAGTVMATAYNQCVLARDLDYIARALLAVAYIGRDTISPCAIQNIYPIDMRILLDEKSKREERRLVWRGSRM